MAQPFLRPYLLSALALGLAALVPARLAAQPAGHTVAQLAEGVYMIRHQPAGGVSGQGNTTVVIGERAVFVVDSALMPTTAREDIAQIRQWTDRPVVYLLNTHWHNDHVMGNGAYLEAFPSLTIIAHAETRKDMDLVVPSAPQRIAASNVLRRQRLEAGVDEAGTPLTEEGRTQARQILDAMELIREDYEATPYQSPTLTFVDELTIDLGGREVRVLHPGRGNTAGDAVVYLPRERILVTGDLVVRPLPYFYDGYPSEWVGTMERLIGLDAVAIVPGHGDVLRDDTYLVAIRDILQSAVQQLNDRLRELGPAEFLTYDKIEGSIDLSAFRDRFIADHPEYADYFDDVAERLSRLAFNEAVLR